MLLGVMLLNSSKGYALHFARPQVLAVGATLSTRPRAHQKANYQPISGKTRVKSLLASILTVTRLVMIHDRGPVIHPWRSNAHGEPQ